MSNRSSSSNMNSVFYADKYHPIQAGSIDGTDILPHDSAVYRALLCSSAGLYDPFGDPKVTGDPYCSLFVGRLSPLTTEETLIKAMEKYGTVKNTRLVRHIVTGASRGYAFVEFETERGMRRAYEEAHHTMIDDSEIIVDYNRQQLMPGWIPRRLGGGLGGKKESGQLRFGGRERPFRAPLRPIPYDDLKRLGIPPPPEGKYKSRFQVPSPPRRNGSSMEREDLLRERTYVEHSIQRYSAEREYSSRRSVDTERHSHRKSRRYEEDSPEGDNYKERTSHSKKKRSVDKERSTRHSKDRTLDSLSDSGRDEELSHRKSSKDKDGDTSWRTKDRDERTSHRRSKDQEERSSRRSKDNQSSSSRRSKDHREHSRKRHKHSNSEYRKTRHGSGSQDSR